MTITKDEYLQHLASLASGLDNGLAASDTDLEAFRALIMSRPADLRRRLLGANVERRRRLDGFQRQALDTLEVSPDLLGPLDELRYEPAHSRLLARFLSPAVEPRLGASLLRSFLHLTGCAETALTLCPVARVEPERWVPRGRLDISITLPNLLVFIEMKIDADEGEDQLRRYSLALSDEKGSREGLLVYLTLPGGRPSVSGVPHVHLTMMQLLHSWLPHAGLGNGSEQYLARYLKSVALVLGCCGVGRFDDWSTAHQAAALDVVETIHEVPWTR